MIPAPARLLLAMLLSLVACRSDDAPDPRYRPTENLLEVVALLRLHIDDDTYRFPPARDFTGKNVYRASLARLESLEQIQAERFRAGYQLDVLFFAKGRALERISEYELAERHYARVAELSSPLREEARSARAICDRLARTRKIEPPVGGSVDDALAAFDERERRLERLLDEVDPSHYVYVVREELERNDRERAAYFAARRRLEPGLDALALQQYQLLVQRHAKSKNRNRHLLDVADLYSDLSRDYVARVPAVSLGFDPAVFDEYAFGATRLYESVSQQDGAVEKIEAARKLEAFLAFTLTVYQEKLPR